MKKTAPIISVRNDGDETYPEYILRDKKGNHLANLAAPAVHRLFGKLIGRGKTANFRIRFSKVKPLGRPKAKR